MSEPTYYAQIDAQNVVIDVRVVTAEYMAANPDLYPGTWIETYIGVEGKTYAGLGFLWNGTDFVQAPVVEPQ
jgi:hypothetical protein